MTFKFVNNLIAVMSKKLMLISVVMVSMTTGFSQETTDPKATEVWEPEPRIVTPGTLGAAPSDAIILFDGKDLSSWLDKDGNPAKWTVSEGAMTVAKGTGEIKTKQTFGNIQ